MSPFQVDWNKVLEDTWSGGLIAGAPFVATLAAPAVMSTAGYGIWSAGQTIGGVLPKFGQFISNAGTSTFANATSLANFLNQPWSANSASSSASLLQSGGVDNPRADEKISEPLSE